jgi:hypothetical protein
MEQTRESGGLDHCGKMPPSSLDEGSGYGESWAFDSHARWTRSVIAGQDRAREAGSAEAGNGPGCWASDITAVYLEGTRVPVVARQSGICG